MKKQDFSTSIIVNQPKVVVFNAVTEVSKWWNEEMIGKSEVLHDEFEVNFGNMHRSVQRLIEVMPNEKITWLVTDSNLSFLKDSSEWTRTKIHFNISEKDGKTTLSLTHEGLSESVECYNACSNGWTLYMQNSLRCLIETGKGKPGFPPEEGC
ncbi:MAG: SRPBCC domain-containing protein [Pedobacter sp.]|nr:MAG: SRPBCC domain-containing protein [Pedobacter sp.]